MWNNWSFFVYFSREQSRSSSVCGWTGEFRLYQCCVCSCKSIIHELNPAMSRSDSVRIQFYTNTVFTFMWIFQENKCSAHPNISFTQGYLGRNYFIATQSPLPNTINDFWRLVQCQKSSTIVLLSNVGEKVKDLNINTRNSISIRFI